MKIEKQIILKMKAHENENTPSWNIWSHGVLLRQKCYLLVQYFVCFPNKNEVLTHPRKNFVFIEVAQNGLKLFPKLQMNFNILYSIDHFQQLRYCTSINCTHYVFNNDCTSITRIFIWAKWIQIIMPFWCEHGC